MARGDSIGFEPQPTVSLPDLSPDPADTYTNPTEIVVDAKGRVLSVTEGGGEAGVLHYTVTQVSGSYSYIGPASTTPSGMPYSLLRVKAPAGSRWRLEVETSAAPPSGDTATLAIAQATSTGGSFTDASGSAVTLTSATTPNETIVGQSVTFEADRWIMPRCGFASDNGNFVHYGTTVVRLIREA